MSKIVIDIDEVKNKRRELLDEVEKLDVLIEYMEKYTSTIVNGQGTPHLRDGLSETKFAQAIRLCEDYLKAGNSVNTLMQFMTYIKSRGLTLSRPGLSLALSRSNIKYNKDKKAWELN